MKKTVVALICLVITTCISIGSFLSVKYKSQKNIKKQSEAITNRILFSMDTKNINKITITIHDKTYTVEFQNNKWELTDCPEEKFIPNQRRFMAICTFISHLTAESEICELTEENKKIYGLEDPYIITVTDLNGEHTLYIGDRSPTKQLYYAYTNNKNLIFTINESSIHYILTDPLDLKSDDFLPYSDSDIVGIEVIRNGNTAYVLNYDNESSMWKLADNKYNILTVNQTRPSSIISVVTRISAEKMYQKSNNDIITYGFDNPDAELIIIASDGTKKDILFKYYGKNAKTYIHTYTKEDAQVAVYYTVDFDFLNYNIVDLICQTIECANMYSISEITYKKGNNISETFTKNIDTNTVTCRGTLIDLNNVEFKNFFENFYNTFAYITVSEIDVDVNPELKDPIFSSIFTKYDGIVNKFDLVDNGKGMAYIFANGKYTGMLTNIEFLDEENGDMRSAYEILCRHIGLEFQKNDVKEVR